MFRRRSAAARHPGMPTHLSFPEPGITRDFGGMSALVRSKSWDQNSETDPALLVFPTKTRTCGPHGEENKRAIREGEVVIGFTAWDQWCCPLFMESFFRQWFDFIYYCIC